MPAVAAGKPATASSASRLLVRATWADLRLLMYVAAADLVFAAGVLAPYLTRADHPTTSVDAWLGYPAYASLFLLPMLAVAAAAVAATRLGAAGSRRRVAIAVLLLAVAGFVAYVSPLGVSAVRWFLD
jgi:hypothetical protein